MPVWAFVIRCLSRVEIPEKVHFLHFLPSLISSSTTATRDDDARRRRATKGEESGAGDEMILSQRVIIATTRDGLRDDVAGQAELFDELGDDGAVVFVHLAAKIGEFDAGSFQ